jgi:hypothetical protein
MEHNFFKHPSENSKFLMKICDDPSECITCIERLNKLNAMRLESFLNDINPKKPIYRFSFDIIPTEFFIGFQNFSMIKVIIEKFVKFLNQKNKYSIQRLNCLMTTFTSSSFFYTFPILQIELYFFGNISKDLKRQIKDFGDLKIPILTGDVGILELIEKDTEQLKSVLIDRIDNQDEGHFQISEKDQMNIYGSDRLKDEFQYLSIFHIHPIDLKNIENQDWTIETFESFHKNYEIEDLNDEFEI